MNKVTLMLATIVAVASKELAFIGRMGNAPVSSRTPNIPGNNRHHKTRAHAPADGRWHMKFHRGRV